MSRRLKLINKQVKPKPPMIVCVTGASGNISYSIFPLIGRGLMLGADQPIHLRMLDIPQMKDALQGVAMQVRDCAFPLLQSITPTTSAQQGFKEADVIIFIGGLPRKQGMERKDLISVNTDIYKSQGQILNAVGKSTTKCLVVANPANTNCLALMTRCPNIPKENFTCLTRLDQNRAIWQIAERTNTQVGNIRNLTIWGNHSSTLYPDVNQGTVGGQFVRQFVQNDEWLNNEFIKTVQQRGAAIIKARKHSSAMSAASAAVDHVRDWCFGTSDGWVSMGVISDGSYGVPSGLIFSFPVKCREWKWEIVQDIPLDKFSLGKICDTARELDEEKKAGGIQL